LLAQGSQPGPDGGQGLVEVVHARQFATSAKLFADVADNPACSSQEVVT
jgi:hypothetical protein